MFRKLTFAAAIVLGSVVLSAPVFSAQRGGEVDSPSDDFSQMQARTGFGESQEMGFDQLAQHRNGYDGDRYWHNGECFPTAPGGCD